MVASMARLQASRLILLALALSSIPLATAASSPASSDLARQYRFGDAVPVTCVNRTIETGEHMVDEAGRIQYVPFPTCGETGRPLELYFGVEGEVNCTIDFIDDPFFHLLEFYIHNDAPLTCRIPSRPILPVDAANADEKNRVGVLGTEDSRFVPLVVAISGVLQFSHLHVSNNLNVLVHAADKATTPGAIDAATAYSVSHLTRNTEIIIGDKLPLRFSVRWYPSVSLPSGWRGVGGHLYLSTLLYCILSAGGSAALCIAYYRGIVLPKRLKAYGYERTFSTERGRYNGYGYGIGGGAGAAPPSNGIPGLGGIVGKQD